MDRSCEKKNNQSIRANTSGAGRTAVQPSAEADNAGKKTLPVTVKIITKRTLADGSAFEIPDPPPGMCMDLDAMEDDESGTAGMVLITPEERTDGQSPKGSTPERVELVVRGELVQSEERVSLTWEEHHDSGMTEETISFDPAAPEVVTYLRSARSAMDILLEIMGAERRNEICFVLEPKKRHISVYKDGDETGELAVRTLRVENSLLRRGVMLLDYTVEIHGVRAEKTKMLIKIKKCDPD